ncbi:tyrosine-type recombinase/integrase [Micromonospora chersina]|uniref:tyrosine-type recombinase/integrase n=1 Tax=Micromonospora chersina TaxID=47854 RepID=UPI001AD7FD52|nr:tyrosine-type recombinase/integrase [Micromonospora chersina]
MERVVGVPLAVKAWTLERYLHHWLTEVVLTPQDVRKLLTAKRQAGLSVRMVRYIHAVLRNALQNAVREGLVTHNVARLVQVETPDYEDGQGLAILQAQRLLETVRPTRWYSLYVLALMLGLRRGELLGLRWSDVDLDRKTLTVRQNLVRASGELRVGTPIEPRNLTRHFYSVRDRAGLPGIRFHDLRHTCLTLLFSLGTPPHIAQAIAGHSHVDVTMMIYVHSGMAEQTEALRKAG